MLRLHSLLFIILMASILSSCKTDIGADMAVQTDREKADIQTYAASKGLVGTSTASGLYYVLKKADSSTVAPALGQELEFNYKLYVLYGPSNTTVTSGVTDKLLDSAYATTSVYYPFFANSLRPGLQEGFLLMHEGDQATFLMPSTLAFGSVASKDGNIPANSPVRYDIKLKRSRTEDQQINEYITANKFTLTETTSSGLRFIKTVSNPSGTAPTASQTLIVNYRARLLRTTTPFDSIVNNSYSTSLGKSALAGFNEGLAKLKTGEKATIIFPSSLGYKTSGAVNSEGTYVVPPYTPLRFDIELVSAQ